MKWIFLDLPVQKAKWITTVSDKSKEEIIKYTKCDPNKIFVIANPIAKECSLKLNYTTSNEPRLLFIGTQVNKNLEKVIPALYGLNIRLRIIGKLSIKQLLLLRKFEIKYSNVFHISEDELSGEYQNADIVLFPSLYEGFGLPVIEGFCAGKPVITSDISPMKDIAGDAAILVDPHSISSIRSAVITAIDDVALRESKIEKGKLVASRYESKKIFTQYELLWNKVHESTKKPTF